MSQWIVSGDTGYYVHHFFIKEGKRLIYKSDKDVFVLFHGGLLTGQEEKRSTLIFAPGGSEKHILFDSEPEVLEYFVFTPSFLHYTLELYPFIATFNDGEAVTNHYILTYAWQSIREQVQTVSSKAAFIEEKARELLRLYCDRLQEEQPTIDGVNAKEYRTARMVKSIIEQDLGIHYTVAELARKTGWNTFSLKETFPKVYGVTPYQHLIHCRMSFGKHLVCSTNYLISQIASDCGYKQEHHFIKLFKKTFGVTPGRMREDI